MFFSQKAVTLTNSGAAAYGMDKFIRVFTKITFSQFDLSHKSYIQNFSLGKPVAATVVRIS